MKIEVFMIFISILVLLIGCTCLGDSGILKMREGMTEGQYTKNIKDATINGNHYGTAGKMATNEHQQFNSYNNGNYASQNAMDNSMISQESYERQQMNQAHRRMSSETQYGLPRNQIPLGNEDLYILKSEIVPPVCPACPTVMACDKGKKAQPCPPCGRCPEPSFECKKVPNYKAINPSHLPKPILNDFSQFGM